MKCLSQYRDVEKARAYRRRCKRNNYYAKRAIYENYHRPYTTKECKMVLEHKLSDRELAKELKRSIPAIQGLRHRLNNR